MIAGALLITVVLAALDIRDPFARTFVGGEWFAAMISDSALHAAALRQIVFTGLVLAIEVPLGIAIAFALLRHGGGATLWIILLALPLATPLGGDRHDGPHGGAPGCRVPRRLRGPWRSD